MTAHWHPAGVWGLVYWYAMFPAHLVLFDALVKEIAARATRCQNPRASHRPGTDLTKTKNPAEAGFS